MNLMFILKSRNGDFTLKISWQTATISCNELVLKISWQRSYFVAKLIMPIDVYESYSDPTIPTSIGPRYSFVACVSEVIESS